MSVREGVAPGKLRLLVEAGNQLLTVAQARRWIMSNEDREKLLKEWKQAVDAAREELG